MDRKSFIVLGVSFLLLLLWYPLVNRMFPPVPLPHGSSVVTTATNRTILITNTLPSEAEAPPPAGQWTAPKGPEELVTIENENARYTFTSHGGGLKFVEIKGYLADVDCNPKKSATNRLATLNGRARAPIMALAGGEAIQGDNNFKLSKTTNAVIADKVLSNGLHLVKVFQLSTNYLLKTNIRLDNQTTQAVTLPAQEWIIGTAAPIGQQDESQMLSLQWYNGSKPEDVGEVWFANRPAFGCGLVRGNPRDLYTGGASNVDWAAVHNQFFAIVAVPAPPAPQVVGHRINLPPSAPSPASATPAFGYQAGLLYPPTTLQPNQKIEHHIDIYAGPKEYNTLANKLAGLGKNLDLVMKFGFFGWFAQGLLLAMNGLNHLGFAYGAAIVAITIIIKLVFWPLTKASTRSMKRMAALQPQMKALQEKYKDDPKKMNLKLMEFMKENKVSPLGGCLPMVLQIPVFIGFYTMLRSAIELRGAHFLWACDLSKPDTVWIIPGTHFPVNPMPLLMGVTMLWQARLTPPSPGMDPVQQKIMKYMPLIFMGFLYNFSAGLTLYWTVQNLLTIAQMKLTKAAGDKTSLPAQPATRPSMSKKKRF